jgi:hypothetical protein
MKHCLVCLALFGCTGGLTSDPQPIVSVLKQDGECFALMTPQAPVATALGVSGTCGYLALPTLLAGVDFVEVVVDYGPDVTFAGTTIAPRPDVVVTVDGVASEEPVEVSDEYRVGGRAYFIATFYAPRQASRDVRVTAGVNAGFQTIVPIVFTTTASPVGLRLLDCITPPCTLPGATGSAHLYISVPGTRSHLVAIHSILDGISQPDPIPPVQTLRVLSHSEATTAVPVPAAKPDTTWTLVARASAASDAQQNEVSATIIAPPLETKLSCGTACNVSTGDAVGLEIVAPAGIRPLEALVDTRIDGVPQLVATRVPLVLRADGTAVGALGLTAPASPGAWEIDVSVAGYRAPVLMTSVQ